MDIYIENQKKMMIWFPISMSWNSEMGERYLFISTDSLIG